MVIGFLIIGSILVYSLLSNLIRLFNRKPKTNKSNESQRIKPPRPKDFDNYYDYKAKLVEYNEQEYSDHLRNCALNGEIPIEKEIISKPHEKRINDFNNLIK